MKYFKCTDCDENCVVITTDSDGPGGCIIHPEFDSFDWTEDVGWVRIDRIDVLKALGHD